MFNLISILRKIALVAVPVLLGYVTYHFLTTALMSPYNASDKSEVFVEIAPGTNFREVCRLLQDRKIIRYARSLDLLARLK